MRNHPGDSDLRLATAVGTVVTIAVVTPYLFALASSGRTDVIRQSAYNAPIAFVFFVLATDLVLIYGRGGLPELVRRRGPVLLVWVAATVVLVLRFAPTRIEVSGHLTWLPLLTADAWVRGLPVWFLGCAAAATALAIYLKFEVFGGPSAAPGLITGAVLAAVVLWTSRRTKNDDAHLPGRF